MQKVPALLKVRTSKDEVSGEKQIESRVIKKICFLLSKNPSSSIIHSDIHYEKSGQDLQTANTF